MLVLYSKEYENNIWCIKEFTYSEKISKIIFVIDNTQELNQNILSKNQKSNFMIKGKFTNPDPKKISLLSTKYIVNDNVIFDFKKRFNFVNGKILLKKILFAHLIAFLLWFLLIFILVIYFIFNGYKFYFNNNYKNRNNIIILIITDSNKYNIKISFTKAPKTKERVLSQDFYKFLVGLLLLTNGAYWFVFFQINNEYKDILRFFNVKKNDIEYASYNAPICQDNNLEKLVIIY